MIWALRDLGYLAPDAPIGAGDGLSGSARAAIVRYGRVWGVSGTATRSGRGTSGRSPITSRRGSASCRTS